AFAARVKTVAVAVGSGLNNVLPPQGFAHGAKILSVSRTDRHGTSSNPRKYLVDFHLSLGCTADAIRLTTKHTKHTKDQTILMGQSKQMRRT
ncbi:MAG: hypothetical protein ACLQIB_03285, partial [Isosphaeraceae bacterium]